MSEATAIYELLPSNVYRPTRWAGSPWSSSMQHGGPIIGLFAREAEGAAAGIGMQVVRLTVDLFKAVPMVPLSAKTRFTREGRRVAGLETMLRTADGGDPVSRATALLLRPAPHDGPSWATDASPPPLPDQAAGADRPAGGDVPIELPPGFHEKVEIRPGIDGGGPYVWMTTPLDLVDGESISAFQRASALTDMTLGSQMRMAIRRREAATAGEPRPTTGGLMINTDTTVYWERPFVGAHLGLRPQFLSERDGIGAAEAILFDAEGRVGRATQAALLQRHFGQS